MAVAGTAVGEAPVRHKERVPGVACIFLDDSSPVQPAMALPSSRGVGLVGDVHLVYRLLANQAPAPLRAITDAQAQGLTLGSDAAAYPHRSGDPSTRYARLPPPRLLNAAEIKADSC